MVNLNRLSETAHRNAVEHGFWADRPSTEHCLMLVVTEIAEMVEADRQGKSAILKSASKRILQVRRKPAYMMKSKPPPTSTQLSPKW